MSGLLAVVGYVHKKLLANQGISCIRGYKISSLREHQSSIAQVFLTCAMFPFQHIFNISKHASRVYPVLS